MQRLLLLTLALLGASSCAPQDGSETWITIDNETLANLMVNHSEDLNVRSQKNGFSIVRTNEEALATLSTTVHHSTNRCAGFFTSGDMDEAIEMATTLATPARPINLDGPRINSRIVKRFLKEVDSEQIRKTINVLSNKFKTRYYKSESGQKSQAWLAQLWRSYNVHRRSDFNVKAYKHKNWPQPSIIASIKGRTHPDEMIVIGGHGDSISGMFGSANRRSPGADDNASGISTISEILRVILSSTYRPARTIVFMSYAAEEVGLRGSREIAKAYAKEKKKVIAAMQLDMTNHRTEDGVISFIRDNTDDELTVFTQKIADKYLPNVNWTNDKCGYACSDHASWTAAGYASVFPFESRVKQMNKKIHTANDTLENSDATAKHASIFARLGVAFAMELGR